MKPGKKRVLSALLPTKRRRKTRRRVQVRRPKAAAQSGVMRRGPGARLFSSLRSLLSLKRGRTPSLLGRGYRPGRTPMAARGNPRLRLCGIFCGAGLVVAVFIWGGVSVYNRGLQMLSEVFVVEHIRINGAGLVPRSQVIEALGVVKNKTGMYEINRKELEQQLEALPWVRHAAVSRNLLSSTLQVTLTEEKAVALLVKEADGSRELFYLDRYGRVFEQVQPGGAVDYPVVTGFADIDDDEIAEQAWDEVMEFLRRLWGNNAHLPAHSLSEIHVTKDGGIVLYLVEYPFPIFFGRGEVKKKYTRLVEVLKPLYESDKGHRIIEEVEYIQMEYLENKVLVATAEAAQVPEKARKQARK